MSYSGELLLENGLNKSFYFNGGVLVAKSSKIIYNSIRGIILMSYVILLYKTPPKTPSLNKGMGVLHSDGNSFFIYVYII